MGASLITSAIRGVAAAQPASKIDKRQRNELREEGNGILI
jgi:hypothetical protein